MESDLNKILNDLNLRGKIAENDHPLVKYIKSNKNKMQDSKIKYSYIQNAIWKEYKIDEDCIYLFRIVSRIDKNAKDLIIKEYKIHEENEDINYFCPEFICFYFSNFLNFCVFKINNYFTLEEILKQNVINFSKKELFLALSKTINILKDNLYLLPFISPSNILYTENSGKEYFYLSEIFIKSESIDKEIEVGVDLMNEWVVPEYENRESKITLYSNICCLGYLFYTII